MFAAQFPWVVVFGGKPFFDVLEEHDVEHPQEVLDGVNRNWSMCHPSRVRRTPAAGSPSSRRVGRWSTCWVKRCPRCP